MAQDLTVNIKTTSDVPQAMDRAKAATVSFGKQVEDIQKKFSMAFKDVFLSFLGPMALIGIAMNYIGKLIDENRKKQEEANQAAIDGTNALISAEDKYWANKRNNEKKASEETQQAAVIREETTRQFMIFERDRAVEAMSEKQRASFLTGARMEEFTRDPEYQKKIQALIAEDLKKNPSLGAKPEEGKSAGFKGPEGFSNVVGVGANPVIEAMSAQLEEQRKQTALLEKIASPGGSVQKDFTKEVPLPIQKSGL
jgi:hypothetical protein